MILSVDDDRLQLIGASCDRSLSRRSEYPLAARLLYRSLATGLNDEELRPSIHKRAEHPVGAHQLVLVQAGQLGLNL